MNATIDTLDLSPSPHRDYTRLPGTVDRGRFVAQDALMVALVPSLGPHIGGLSSKSVKDCRLSAGSKPTIRSVGAVSITGGAVEGAQGEAVNWGHGSVMAQRSVKRAGQNAGRRTGKNARKRARRA